MIGPSGQPQVDRAGRALISVNGPLRCRGDTARTTREARQTKYMGADDLGVYGARVYIRFHTGGVR